MTRVRRRAIPLLALVCAALATACTSEGTSTMQGFYAEVRVEVEPQPDDPLARVGSAESGGVIRWWYASDPVRWRWEVEAGGSPIDAGTLTTVFDGEDTWSYDDRSNVLQRTDPPDLPPGTVLAPPLSAPVGPANVDSIEAFVEQWEGSDPDREVRLAGEEEVLGRATRVVEIRPAWHSASSSAAAPAAGETPQPAAERETSGGVVRAYIDPERMFIMRWDVDGEGRGQSYRAEVTRLDYGIAIDEGRVEFEPPPDAREVAASGGASCESSIGPVGGATVPTEPGFLAPAYVPSGYTSTSAGSEGGSAECEIVATWTLLESGDSGYVQLRQRVRVGLPDTVHQWQRVQVDGLEGYRTSEDGIERLVWRDGEIVALLESNALPFEELLRIAESAEHVSADTPPVQRTPVGTATPTSTSAPVAGDGSPGDIQAAIEAALSGDGERLGALLTTTEGPCVVDPPPDILRAPACPPDATAGTPVDALLVGGCPDEPSFIDPAITYRVEGFDASMFLDHVIGIVDLEAEPLHYAALFGFEKVGWLGFDEAGRLIGAGGGGDCAAFDLRPRLADATWLVGPDWGE